MNILHHCKFATVKWLIDAFGYLNMMDFIHDPRQHLLGLLIDLAITRGRLLDIEDVIETSQACFRLKLAGL